MPKMKTNRSGAKRFKVTATGKVKRWKAGHRHILASKDRKRKNRLQAADTVNHADFAHLRRILPYGQCK
ncbi:MAG: 50S ribosomal protein L35 [Acidobacteria bacterium]|nr:50S ribosomal protein L35 [Acidobacteriota bacterium]